MAFASQSWALAQSRVAFCDVLLFYSTPLVSSRCSGNTHPEKENYSTGDLFQRALNLKTRGARGDMGLDSVHPGRVPVPIRHVRVRDDGNEA